MPTLVTKKLIGACRCCCCDNAGKDSAASTPAASNVFPVGVFMRRFPPCSYDCVGSGSFYRAVPLRTHAGGAPFGELTVVAAPRRCRYSLAPDASIGRSRRPVRERQARTILPRDVDVIANAQQEAWELPAR